MNRDLLFGNAEGTRDLCFKHGAFRPTIRDMSNKLLHLEFAFVGHLTEGSE
jgi:hypothetical protein